MAELIDFRLPSLGADMDHGTIIEWLVAPGDTVARGDIVALVDTEKSEIELEIWSGGVLHEIVVEAGTEIEVGSVLARLVPDGHDNEPAEPALSGHESASSTPPAEAPGTTPESPAVRSPLVRRLAEAEHIDLTEVRGTGPGGRVTRHDVEAATRPVASPRLPVSPTGPDSRRQAPLASPRARRMAADATIDLRDLTGTGREGAILARDVERAIVARSSSPPATDQPRGRTGTQRKAIARVMSRANRDIPHYHLAIDIDVDTTMTWLDETNASRPPAQRVLPAAVLLRAAALAARAHPELNGFWEDDSFLGSDSVHLGVAVSQRSGGLVAPAIHDADTKSVDEIMAALRDLVTRARAGRLRGAELSDPTITVTALGDRGPDLVHGVIQPPQVALIGFGRIAQRPAVVGSEVAVRTTVTATLAGDHRATDGDRGARFLATLDRLLGDRDALTEPHRKQTQ